jgi:hypothetical protein
MPNRLALVLPPAGDAAPAPEEEAEASRSPSGLPCRNESRPAALRQSRTRYQRRGQRAGAAVAGWPYSPATARGPAPLEVVNG